MENKFELVNYAIAESAAIGAEVDGHLACRVCGGAGLIPSSQELTSKDTFKRRSPRLRGNHHDWHQTPVTVGVDLCRACEGDGHQR